MKRGWWDGGVSAIICMIAWCVILTSAEMSDSPDKTQILRTKRQIKVPVPKDSSGYSPANNKNIQALASKLAELETKVDAMGEGVKQPKKEMDKNLLKTLQEGLTNASRRDDLLEEQLKQLSVKLQDIEVSLGADEDYWSTSTECGGVMVSQMGKISHTDPYRPGPMHSRTSCVWTIRANHRSKIHVQLTSLSAHVIVTELIIAEDGTHFVNHTKIANTRLYIFNGPVIFITSLTRSLALGFAGHGKKVHENTEFLHFHFNKTQDTYDFNARRVSEPGMLRSFTTVVNRIDPSTLVELDIILPRNGCDNASFHIQTGDFDFDGVNGKIKNNSACCVGHPTSCAIRRYTLDGWFAASYSKLLPNVYINSNNALNVSWKATTNQSDSIDKCGGVLMGKGGKISYKRFTTYTNNERCVWVIYPFPKNSVKILQFSSHVESVYDHVTVLEVDKEQETSTALSTLLYITRNFTGRVVLLTFYSDSSILRQGFELHWEAVGPSDYERSLENEKIMHNSMKHTKSNNIALVSQGFALHVITNGELDGSSLDVSVKRKQFLQCPTTRLKMFGTMEGQLSVADGTSIVNPCTVSGSPVWNTSSSDGVGIIFVDNKDPQGKVDIDVAWNFVLPDPGEVIQQDKCGGVIRRLSGRLSYKLDSLYDNGERCVWLIHSPTSSEIRLKLSKEAFELCCDYVLVNTIDFSTGLMNNSTAVLTRENNTRTFPGNLVVVTFRSDASVTGKGFVLEYYGQGPRLTSPHKLKLLHLDEVVGSYHYRRGETGVGVVDGWGDGSNNEGDEDKDKIFVIAYSTPTDAGEGSIVTVFNVTVSDTNFGVDDNCKSDVLNFYSTPSREGFTLGESYPKLQCQPSPNGCGNCAANKLTANDTVPHTFGSAYRAFVGIYKPAKSSIISNQSFHIRWDSSSGCGGIEQQESGRIVYKLNARYKNLEQCIWTVHIPSADKIRFVLLNNGFEACCDNLIISPLDPKTGSIGISSVMKSSNTIEVVKGPVVFVTFRTDASVTGEGFTLTYTGIPALSTTPARTTPNYDEFWEDYSEDGQQYSNSTTITPRTYPTTPAPPPTFNYFHYHFHRRNSSFTYPSTGLPSSRGLGLNDILTITFSPESLRNESFALTGSNVIFKILDLQVNNETCVSDSLKFFEAWTRDGFNASRSYSVPIPDPANCTEAVTRGQWGCDNCLANQTESDTKRGLRTYHPSFIAIYKSVTSIGEHGNKTLKIEWTDFIRGSETSSTTSRTMFTHNHFHI